MGWFMLHACNKGGYVERVVFYRNVVNMKESIQWTKPGSVLPICFKYSDY